MSAVICHHCHQPIVRQSKKQNEYIVEVFDQTEQQYRQIELCENCFNQIGREAVDVIDKTARLLGYE